MTEDATAGGTAGDRALAALGVLVLLTATVLVHAPRDADFAYDDKEFVVANQSIRSLSGALAALALPFPPEQPERGLYRPLTNASYAVDYALWGGTASEALGFHLTNVALYVVVVLLVARLAFAYLRSPGFAFAVALLFALHPVHCDAVDNVAGRSEILSLLFSLISLLLFVRRVDQGRCDPRPFVGSAASYALACLFKETGAVLPAVLAGHLIALAPRAELRRGLRAFRPLLPHLVVLVAYLALRGAVLGRFSPEAAILRDHDLATRLSTIGTVFLVNLKLLVWPNLQVDFFYQAAIPLVARPTPSAVLGWMLLLLSAGGTAWLLWRHLAAASKDEAPARRRERATALCGLAVFFVGLLPTSHVLDFGALVAERFLFVPSLGFLLVVVVAARRALTAVASPRVRIVSAGIVLATVALAWGERSRVRAHEWRDPVRLWSAAARALPADRRVHTNLAAVHLDRGELEPARAALERALALDPDYRPALGNLGVLQLEQGQLEAAEATYRRLLEAEPDDYLAWYNLGLIETKRGRHARAAEHFRRSLELNPNFSHAQTGLEHSERRMARDPAGPRR